MSNYILRPGLVSITFRSLKVAEIISLVVQAGLEGIEWGGDVHVPPDRPALARAVARQTRDAGLTVSAYGSYYRLGHEAPGNFEQVMETARELGAPIVRVWLGRHGSKTAPPGYRAALIEETRALAEQAEKAGLLLACEWHADTLTDELESARSIQQAVAHPAFRFFWQPGIHGQPEICLRELQVMLPLVVGLHVFSWTPESRARLELKAGAAWKTYLAVARAMPASSTRFASLEFVRNDDPQQLLADAATLLAWLERGASCA